MHLAYHEPAPDTVHSPGRRSFLKRAGVSIAMAGIAQNAIAGTRPGSGFTGTGRMNLSTGEDWIDTFLAGVPTRSSTTTRMSLSSKT